MNKSCKLAVNCKLAVSLSLLSLVSLSSLSSLASHIEETITLTKGWNAIYLESTPTNAACAEFFAGAPVERVASYHSDAYSSTRQIADDGTTIEQKPVSYSVWVPGDDAASTMASLVGGRTYMIYASDSWTTNFFGVPAAPQQTWRATADDASLVNLAGVSIPAGEVVSAKAYFGEGPFGTVSGTAYKISGKDSAAPKFLSMMVSSKPQMRGGGAYALTAETDADWPGVIGVQGRGLFFGAQANYASIAVKNCGTTNHTFRFSISASADATERVPALSRRLPRVEAIGAPGFTNATDAAWTVELAAGEQTDQVFGLDRSRLEAGKKYGAILTIQDLGASKMRVRLPVVASPAQTDAAAYPAGLWLGEIALSLVSGIDDATPVPAGGKLKMNVMMHVDENRKCTLLQRVAFGADADGKARLFKELEGAEAAGIANAKRFSTVMMSVDTPHVASAGGSAFGDTAEFAWTVAPDARDNPFRHAWHPDHDGKKADYSGEAPSGDNPSNYANPVKPELWSINNRLTFSWHEGGNGASPVNFAYNADESTAGIVFWEVEGLVAKGPITCVGTFALKRVFKAKELE